MKKTTVSLAILALIFAGISEVIAQKHIVRRGSNRRTAPSLTQPHKKVYSYKDNYIEGLARVTFKKKWGFIDEKGIEVIPCKYDYVDSFEEGLSMVSLNEKYGFIDKAGIEVVPCVYDLADTFSENRAKVDLNGKIGYVDKSGTLVIPCKYDAGGWFDEGFAQRKMGLYRQVRHPCYPIQI